MSPTTTAENVVSSEDNERYAEKHVMTDGIGGPVVASGDTFKEMLENASLLDEAVREHGFITYIPRGGIMPFWQNPQIERKENRR